MRLLYGPWAPDSAGLDVRDAAGHAIMSVARNVYPLEVGYGPISAAANYSTTALPTKCLGLFFAKTSSGAWVAFAATATKIYRLVDTVWTDYSRLAGGNYNATTDDKWSGTQFGSRFIMVNPNDDPQYIDVDSGATNFAVLPNAPRARYVRTVGDFVVLASLSGGDTRKVRNSAINNSEGWTVGTNLCDEQEFPEGGRVTGVSGGESGLIVQEKAIRRMIFQPGQDYAFRYELIDRERGCAAAYGLASVGDRHFFPSDDGFYEYNSQEGLKPIGAEVVNDWFGTNSDATRFFEVLSFVDPFAPRIGWAFYNSDGDASYSRALFFNWKTGRFSYGEVTAAYWANYATAGVTLESLDVHGTLEAVPFSLDSRVWEGGRPGLALITSDGYLAFLDGTAKLDATLTTCQMHMYEGGRAKSFDIEPVVEKNDATVTMRIGKQEQTGATVSYTSAISPSTRTGMVRGRASGRIHTFELNITQSSGTGWNRARGLDIAATRDGSM